jgi:hypothetical protein
MMLMQHALRQFQGFTSTLCYSKNSYPQLAANSSSFVTTAMLASGDTDGTPASRTGQGVGIRVQQLLVLLDELVQLMPRAPSCRLPSLQQPSTPVQAALKDYHARHAQDLEC